MTGPYFDVQTLNAQLLFWGGATRTQLDRWEPLVAEIVREGFAKIGPRGGLVWRARMERHFCLIAAGHLVKVLDKGQFGIPIDQVLRAELIEGRDLQEHWHENMPIFNAKIGQPQHRSGLDFAQRNSTGRPYSWANWSSKVGAQLLPHVAATDVHGLIDRCEEYAIRVAPNLAPFRTPRAPSPWIETPESSGWWPRGRE